MERTACGVLVICGDMLESSTNEARDRLKVVYAEVAEGIVDK